MKNNQNAKTLAVMRIQVPTSRRDNFLVHKKKYLLY